MSNIETDPRAFLAKKFDIIVVGGGTAGLAVASRLSENANLSIGVLEAGIDKSSTDPVLTSGGGWLITSSDPQYSWGFTSSKQQNLVDPNSPTENGRNLVLPRGKLLGGSSSINAMVWMRAAKAEYDALETTFQNEGWNFDSLKEYFRKSQSHTVQPSEIFPDSKVLPDVHGTDGPVKTSQNWWYSTLVEPHVKTIQSLPVPFGINSNPDGGNPLGLINIARSIDPKTSTRQGALSTYLKATEGRSNITVLVGAQARKITFAEGSGDAVATGVEFEVGGTQYVVEASKEVILSAGAYQTPQLLELSGIGKKSVLDSHGIKQRVELPVGENMQDHLLVPLSWKLKDESVLKTAQPGQEKPALPQGFGVKCVGTDNEETDPNRSAAASVTGGPFLSSDLNSLSANGPQDKDGRLSELLNNLASTASSPLTKAQYELQKSWTEDSDHKYNVADALLMFACLPGMAAIPDATGGMNFWLPLVHLHPTSRGSVHINSNDPLANPTIDLQCLNDYDLRALLRLVKFGDYLVRQEPLASLIVQEPKRTDAEFEDMIRKTASINFHPVGTTPMASRELGGVVDNKLKVYGTKNLRVVDASVLPLQIGAMPQSTIYVIAEKAADIIKAASK